MARHAGSCLEATTAVKTVRVLTEPVILDAPAVNAAPPVETAASSEDEEAARRYQEMPI